MNDSLPNVITLECSVCHRGLFLTPQNFLNQGYSGFFTDFWTGKEYCPDHKPSPQALNTSPGNTNLTNFL